MGDLQEQLKNLGFSMQESMAQETASSASLDTSQPVRLQRQTKGRKGKGVTVVLDLPAQDELLNDYASQLRKHCGVGGSVKGDTIELQGDQRDRAKAWLEKKGFQVKLAGG